ncbi:MAG: hypothetical protein A2511_00105 [Deltaproteobacteria bacterium RIFOXYD12_FULL_50_9]|nr:MAG: hypothetical protein A2511_00105 [Deltaproteobacteria bacterium RIFOXYD12_FULL_50_9]
MIKIGKDPLLAKSIDVLQVNLGCRCNLACKHCHVQAGPLRTEMMAREDIKAVIHILAGSPIKILDLTGGAPELHPDFRFLVTTARAIGCHVMVRSNLAIFFEQDPAEWPDFYKENVVEIIASLPCYNAVNVDAVRGSGVFMQCIQALKLLNERGYGRADGRLKVHLVHNPSGPFLPPPQELLEARYRKELLENFGVGFNCLYTMTNMPLGRFKDSLIKSGRLEVYLGELQKAFNPATLDGIMCRRQVSVGWDGTLADCDFNLAAGIALKKDCPSNVRDFDYEMLCRRQIVVSEHCFGCTASQGSSCTGAVAGGLPALKCAFSVVQSS